VRWLWCGFVVRSEQDGWVQIVRDEESVRRNAIIGAAINSVVRRAKGTTGGVEKRHHKQEALREVHRTSAHMQSPGDEPHTRGRFGQTRWVQ
jgi:hypothetical protein